MLLVGLLITMGIGSSFSTVPIITSIYVPLCLSFWLLTTCDSGYRRCSGGIRDAGSPASDSHLVQHPVWIWMVNTTTLGFCCTNLYSLQHPIIGIRLDCSHDPLIVIIPAFIMRGFFMSIQSLLNTLEQKVQQLTQAYQADSDKKSMLNLTALYLLKILKLSVFISKKFSKA